MSAPPAVVQGFAYGEDVDATSGRSLGYRLLAPAKPEAWSAEVEALARRLQAAPYPDHWPPAELFCSVLLGNGERLIAVARYGLADHTPSHRRSGLELIGVVAPGDVGVPAGLAASRWLRRRRAETEDLRRLGERWPLADLLKQAPAPPAAGTAVSVLPIRLWQDDVLLFAATGPQDPDQRLGLLEQAAGGRWQWLPLVGSDFPLQDYAQRGPLIAWTPHLAGVALKVDRALAGGPARLGRRSRVLTAVLALVLVCLLGANLWAMLALYRRVTPVQPVAAPVREPLPTPAAVPRSADGASREQFAAVLFRHLEKQGTFHDEDRKQFLTQYERLAAADERLRMDSPEGKELVGAVAVLSRRNAGRVKALIRESLAKKGYDPELINLACQRVQDRLTADKAEAP
jgi:hypothetical protein